MFKLALSAAVVAAASAISTAQLDEQWSLFKTTYNKTYSSRGEELKRMAIFLENLELIEQRNAASHGAEHGVTKFADMSQAEFEQTMLTYHPTGERRSTKVQVPNGVASENVDWRTASPAVLTPVKNQLNCGGCWAFSAVSQVESAWALAGNDLTELSVQQVISCDTGDGGCGGGDTVPAYEYINSAGGLETEADYPLTSDKFGITGSCAVDSSKVTQGNIAKDPVYMTDACFAIKDCDDQDLGKLMDNLSTVSPASVCIDASSWNTYKGGVMAAADCKDGYYQLDHCAQLIGYTQGDSEYGDYWIVRNQWGTDWGEENGYIYLELGENTCGVASEATTVTIQ